jgi:hypothetical protein
MNKKIILPLVSVMFGISSYAIAANFNLGYLGKSSGPYDGTSIYKYHDQSVGVLCYVYAPSYTTYRHTNGSKAYDGNHAGSISCVKK